MVQRLSALFVVALLLGGPVAAAPIVRAPALSAPTSTHTLGARVLTFVLVGLGASAFGAIRIKDTGSLAKKFTRNASAAAGDYADGVKQAGADWEAGARAGADNFAAGVQQAIADGRYTRGIADAGAAKYTMRASTLGAQRFPSGVAASEGDWAKGAQPYLQTIASLNLPPRRPKGDPSNMARSQAVASALRAQKVGK